MIIKVSVVNIASLVEASKVEKLHGWYGSHVISIWIAPVVDLAEYSLYSSLP